MAIIMKNNEKELKISVILVKENVFEERKGNYLYFLVIPSDGKFEITHFKSEDEINGYR